MADVFTVKHVPVKNESLFNYQLYSSYLSNHVRLDTSFDLLSVYFLDKCFRRQEVEHTLILFLNVQLTVIKRERIASPVESMGRGRDFQAALIISELSHSCQSFQFCVLIGSNSGFICEKKMLNIIKSQTSCENV